VSTEMTRSRFSIKAAVSEKSCNDSVKSINCVPTDRRASL
jgi:hypothetical protein